MEHVVLSNGVKVPKLGFGVFQISREETVQAVMDAVQVGYRHFDTAQSYMNELELGIGLKESGVNGKIYLLHLKFGFLIMVMKKQKSLYIHLLKNCIQTI